MQSDRVRHCEVELVVNPLSSKVDSERAKVATSKSSFRLRARQENVVYRNKSLVAALHLPHAFFILCILILVLFVFAWRTSFASRVVYVFLLSSLECGTMYLTFVKLFPNTLEGAPWTKTAVWVTHIFIVVAHHAFNATIEHDLASSCGTWTRTDPVTEETLRRNHLLGVIDTGSRNTWNTSSNFSLPYTCYDAPISSFRNMNASQLDIYPAFACWCLSPELEYRAGFCHPASSCIVTRGTQWSWAIKISSFMLGSLRYLVPVFAFSVYSSVDEEGTNRDGAEAEEDEGRSSEKSPSEGTGSANKADRYQDEVGNELTNRSSPGEAALVFWIFTSRILPSLVRYNSIQSDKLLYKTSKHYPNEALSRIVPWLVCAVAVFMDRDLPSRKVRACPIYALVWLMILFMNISYCSFIVVDTVDPFEKTALLTGWTSFELMLAGYAIKRMSLEGSADQLIFLFPIYLSNAFFYCLIYTLTDDMKVTNQTFWGILFLQEVIVGVPKHFGLPEIFLYLIKKHAMMIDEGQSFPWNSSEFVQEKIARSAWDNVSEILSCIFVLLILLVEYAIKRMSLEGSAEPFCLVTCSRSQGSFSDIVLALFVMIFFRSVGMLLTVFSVARFAAWASDEGISTATDDDKEEEECHGGTVRENLKRQKSSSHVYVSALARIVKGNSSLVTLSTAFVCALLVQGLFFVQIGWGRMGG